MEDDGPGQGVLHGHITQEESQEEGEDALGQVAMHAGEDESRGDDGEGSPIGLEPGHDHATKEEFLDDRNQYGRVERGPDTELGGFYLSCGGPIDQPQCLGAPVDQTGQSGLQAPEEDHQNEGTHQEEDPLRLG